MAEQLEVPVLDAYTVFKSQADWRSLLSDGLHLSESGNEALFDALRAVIESECPDAVPDNLPLDMPLHGAFATGCDPKHISHEYLPHDA